MYKYIVTVCVYTVHCTSFDFAVMCVLLSSLHGTFGSLKTQACSTLYLLFCLGKFACYLYNVTIWCCHLCTYVNWFHIHSVVVVVWMKACSHKNFGLEIVICVGELHVINSNQADHESVRACKEGVCEYKVLNELSWSNHKGSSLSLAFLILCIFISDCYIRLDLTTLLISFTKIYCNPTAYTNHIRAVRKENLCRIFASRLINWEK